ncbi:MOSC domain-containing protein [Stachybotrys elegans]|uniref:MOSC domain-containing protein n=1 Tax=Stachybotrys elegans TaxID=80388 RepID=A0A8K0WW21_9HYPO|nr:MOSC domain-containing protein [Stachybotrys elegans]
MGSSVSPFDPLSIFLYLVTISLLVIPLFIIFPPIPVERSDALRQTHKRLGLHGRRSNLSDQYSPAHGAQPGKPGIVQSLFIYPVKSCRGIELAKSRVLPSGLEHDRLYTLAQLRAPRQGAAPPGAQDGEHEEELWEFATQRQLPLLANVKVELWQPDKTKKSRLLGELTDSFIVMRFPWSDKGIAGAVQWLVAKLSRGWRGVPEKEILLPLEFPPQRDIEACGYKYANVKIWKETVSALNMDTELPPELALYLGAKARLGLFRMDPTKQRPVFRCAPTKEAIGYQPVVDFHDAYPIHMLCLSSVQDLTKKIQKDKDIQKLDARRFRANLILSGTGPYEEESWRSVTFRSVDGKEVECEFDVSCRTVRCKMPNVDPDTGIRHKTEPDHAIRKYRNVDQGAPKHGCLGMQLCPLLPSNNGAAGLESLIEVGMQIDKVELGSHLYIDQ